MGTNPLFSADFFTFTEEILNDNIFLCIVTTSPPQISEISLL